MSRCGNCVLRSNFCVMASYPEEHITKRENDISISMTCRIRSLQQRLTWIVERRAISASSTSALATFLSSDFLIGDYVCIWLRKVAWSQIEVQTRHDWAPNFVSFEGGLPPITNCVEQKQFVRPEKYFWTGFTIKFVARSWGAVNDFQGISI